MSDRPDFSPTAVDVVLRPEWQTVLGVDKSFRAVGAVASPPGFVYLDYTVPAGKTLYITDVGFSAITSVLADADLNTNCSVMLYDNTLVEVDDEVGGNYGGGKSYSVPHVFAAGTQFELRAYNKSGHAMTVSATARGYEL